MKTLEKQQKNSHYSIYLGYHTLIEQDILQGLLNPSDIATAGKNDKGSEFAPGKNVLMNLVTNLGFVRPFTNVYENYLKFSKTDSPLLTLYKFFLSIGIAPNKIYMLLDSLVLTILYFQDKSKLCTSNMIIPIYLADFIKNNMFQGFDDQKFTKISMTRHIFQTVVKQMLYNISSVLTHFPYGKHVIKYLLGDGLNINKDDFKYDFFKNNNKIQNHWVWNAFMNLWQLVHKVYLQKNPLLNIVLYSGISIGTISFYRVICEKIVGNKLHLRIRINDFDKLLKEVMYNVNPKISLDEAHYRDTNKLTSDTRILKFDIPNKIYTDNNDVSSQLHFVVKHILKNVPQNVFLHKIEYIGKDDNVLLKGTNDLDQPDNVELQHAIDTIQVLWSLDKRDRVISERKMNGPEKNMVKYARQYHELYKYYNRTDFYRRHVFDLITKQYKEPELSPMIPHKYVIQFQNTTDQNHLIYFYRSDVSWFKHVKTLNKNKDHKDEIYEVELYMKKRVDKYLLNIFSDLPRGLYIKRIIKPVMERKTKHPCPYYLIFPRDPSDDCYAPLEMLSEMDKRLIQIARPPPNKTTDVK